MTAQAAALLPLPVLVPLAMAALLLTLAHWLHPRVGDVAGVLCAAFVMVLCAWLARASAHGPVVQWFGGWTPAVSGRPGVVLGVAFSADPASAAAATLSGLLFLASFLFSWSYFDRVGVHYHVLMLAFLAAMAGFCLTRDLFNLFVWFELMSVAAYALTAYPLGSSSLEGAFNFTVVNSMASFLMLAGIGLLYARTGALDMPTVGAALARPGSDPVAVAGFALVAIALLTKGACVPFHFWLADAHAVAPSPVSVIFSGAMVSVALFGLAKLVATVFAGDAAILGFVRHVLPWLGGATALVGSVTAWGQRHLKRLLAFSTIAHLGIMLTAVAEAGNGGMPGLLLYMAGHGAVKACLFMVAGMLLALETSNDEIDLYGCGRQAWPLGLLMAAAALMLGGAPIGVLHDGLHAIEGGQAARPLLAAVLMAATAITGAAVLRAALRIFARASGTPGPEWRAVTERDHGERDRPFWLMFVPAAALACVALVPAGAIERLLALPRPAAHPASWIGTAAPPLLMLAIVALSLARTRAVRPLARLVARAEAVPFRALAAIHDGDVGSYVVWGALGLAAIAVAFA